MADYSTLFRGLTEAHGPLTVPIMETAAETAKYLDITRAPHVLMAGATGSGKSGVMNVMLSTIVRRAQGDVVMDLIDPKRVELSLYADAACVRSVTTEMSESAEVIAGLADEMDARYRLMERQKVRTLAAYNEKTGENLPLHLLAIDELGDLMMTHQKTVLPALARIGQLGRAAGFHMILATQRPAADTIPKLLLANVPTRIALNVQSHTESRLILGEKGAEDLNGAGDMLVKIPGEKGLTRGQGPFLSEDEVESIVQEHRSPDLAAADDMTDEELDQYLEETEDVAEVEEMPAPRDEPDPQRESELSSHLASLIEAMAHMQAPPHPPIDVSPDPELYERIIKAEGKNAELNAENANLHVRVTRLESERDELNSKLASEKIRAMDSEYDLGEARGVASMVKTIRVAGPGMGFSSAMVWAVMLATVLATTFLGQSEGGIAGFAIAAVAMGCLVIRSNYNAERSSETDA